MVRRFSLLLLLAACTRHSDSTPPVAIEAQPAPQPALAPVKADLGGCELAVMLVHAKPDLDEKSVAKLVATFDAEGRTADGKPLQLGAEGFDLAPLHKLSPQVTDAEWTKLVAGKSAALLHLRWKGADAGGLAAAYAFAQKLPGDGAWTLDGQTQSFLDAKAWAALAADAAQKPLRAERHFVNQLYPEDDGSLTIETAGTERFGLRPIRVAKVIRSNARALGHLVNLLVQRWVEGQRPAADGSFDLDLAQLQNAELRAALQGSLLPGAKQRAHLRLVTDSAQEGDLAIAFPGAGAEGERQEATLDALFGTADSTHNVTHTDELLAVSKKARERVIRELKPRVQKGLPPDEVLLVKAPFPCEKGDEWMWVEVQTWSGETVRGALQSDPECAVGYRSGQTVEVKEAELFDYMDKFVDGSFIGNDTGKMMEPAFFEELDGGRRRIRE
ncbi:MAG: DUF2314 domain-containing protein [Deltaproteobacteria bacterium]|nr:DUF2314 domain-containing protein [Deltaproteobacteria bacterium]